MKPLLLSLLALLIPATLLAALTPEQAKQVKDDIAAFSAAEFSQRQKAVDDLVEMGQDVIPLVQQALDGSKDAEVQLRCRMVLQKLDKDYDRKKKETRSAIATPKVKSDPVPWKEPAARPAFRELVPDWRYKSESAAAMKEVNVEALKKDKCPLWCARIDTVFDDSQASRLGIEAGDVLGDINGHRINDQRDIDLLRQRLYQTEGPKQELTVLKPSGAKNTVSLERGYIGIRSSNVWRAPQRYLRSTKRDPRWETDLLVATTCYAASPDLAETALFRAVKAGYRPDALTDLLGMTIAGNQQRDEDALSFAQFALADEPDAPETPLVHATIVETALASYHWEPALKSARQCGWMSATSIAQLDRMLTLHRALPESERVVLPPVWSAEKLERRDMMENAIPLNDMTKDQLGKRGGIHLDVPDNYFHPVVFGPPVKDIEVRTRFRVHPPAGKIKDFARVASVGLLDPESSAFNGRSRNGLPEADLSVVVWEEDGQPTLRIYHTSGVLNRTLYGIPDLHYDYQEANDLALIVHGAHCEVYLNNRRIFYGPRPGLSGKLVPCFKASGMEVQFDDLHVSELMPPAGEAKKP